MATIGSLFREIYRLRRHAAELRSRRDQGPRQLSILQSRLQTAREQLARVQDAGKKLKVELHQGEVSLKALADDNKRYQGQLSQIMSKKEFDALQHEIAAVRARTGTLEDQMLQQMAELEERLQEIPALQQRVNEATSELAEFESNHQQRQQVHTAELDLALKALAELEAQLPPGEVTKQYQHRVKLRGDEALALVRGKTCTACHTEMTHQNAIELRQEGLVFCKSCDRLIFLAEEVGA